MGEECVPLPDAVGEIGEGGDVGTGAIWEVCGECEPQAKAAEGDGGVGEVDAVQLGGEDVPDMVGI